jgi:hypothetical protein
VHWLVALLLKMSTPTTGQQQQLQPKYLRLSHAMHPNNIIFRIQLARRDYSVNSLSCKGLNLRPYDPEGANRNKKRSLVVQDPPGQTASAANNQNQPSITEQLKGLIYSRIWVTIEFESCLGAERLMMMQAPEAKPSIPSISTLFIRFAPNENATNNTLFQQLWKCWKIQKCRLSLEFNAERIQDFSHPESRSELTELDLTGSTWQEEEETNADDDYNNEHISNWRQFCHALVRNHSFLKTLELRKGDLPDSKMACFVDAIVSQHPSLEEINVSGNACQAQTLRALSRAFSNPTTLATQQPLTTRLKILTISNDRLSEDRVPGLQEFCASLHNVKSLKNLKLGEYMIHEQDMRFLVKALSKLSSIRGLSLLSCGMTSQSIHRLCHEGLKQNAIPSLRALSIPEDAKDDMLSALVDNTSLEALLMAGRTEFHTYYLDLNRGGRRALHQSPSVPTSLWPSILARAMPHQAGKHYYGGVERHLDVLYCLLRNKVLLEAET